MPQSDEMACCVPTASCAHRHQCSSKTCEYLCLRSCVLTPLEDPWGAESLLLTHLTICQATGSHASSAGRAEGMWNAPGVQLGLRTPASSSPAPLPSIWSDLYPPAPETQPSRCKPGQSHMGRLHMICLNLHVIGLGLQNLISGYLFLMLKLGH